MIFTSTVFLFLFLPIVFGLYFISPKKAKNAILLIASLFFYTWGEVQYLYVILLSILINYFVGLKIDKYNGLREISGLMKRGGVKTLMSSKMILGIGVVLNLLLLGYFKYANFLIGNLNILLGSLGVNAFANERIHLPVGISFFTFQALSYIIDIYRKEVKVQKKLWNVALYIALFPQLMAGPIIRYKTIAGQLEKRVHSLNDVAEGIRRFICGIGKKMLIANPMGSVADVVFGLEHHELNPATAWIGIVCYTLQIFFDFAGYSDMAIGLGRVFGFKFPENFNFPYISKSIKEFWRRWHISLSTWIKDYLYISMGGNRGGVDKTYRNLFITFLLCGLWHGASWNFIFWGAYQGFFLIVERIGLGKILEKSSKFVQHSYMIFITMIGWVFFRSMNMGQAGSYIASMFDFSKSSKLPVDLFMLMNNFSYLAFGFAILLSMPFASWSVEKLSKRFGGKCKVASGEVKGKEVWSEESNRSVGNWFLRGARIVKGCGSWVLVRDLWLILIFVLSLVRISASTFNPFIYFRF